MYSPQLTLQLQITKWRPQLEYHDFTFWSFFYLVVIVVVVAFVVVVVNKCLFKGLIFFEKQFQCFVKSEKIIFMQNIDQLSLILPQPKWIELDDERINIYETSLETIFAIPVIQR